MPLKGEKIGDFGIKVSLKDRDNIAYLYDKKGYTTKRLSQLFGVTQKGILYILHKNKNINIRPQGMEHIRYDVNENFFEKIDSQEKAYCFGLFLSDGYNNTKRGAIEVQQTKDKDIIIKIKKLLFGKRFPITKKNYSGAYRLYIHRRKISEDLKKLGCVQKKTFKVIFPKIITNDLLPHFIRGYLDGDGCVHFSKPKNNFVVSFTGTAKFCKKAKKLIRSVINVNGYLSTEHNCKASIKKLHYGGRRACIKLLNWLYTDSKIHGNRKFNIYKKMKKVKCNTYVRK